MRWFLPAFLSVLLVSCTKIRPESSDRFLNIDSLLKSQVASLAEAGASLEKSVSLNDSTETQVFHPDTTWWRHEFAIFDGLKNLNKSAYQGDFVAKDTSDRKSNLRVKDIALVTSPGGSTNSSLTLRRVLIYYFEDGTLERLEGLFEQHRPMFQKEERIVLHFGGADGGRLLNRYEVLGGQKIVMGDTLTYRIVGVISTRSND